jgi:hypothetical protein
VNYASGDQVRLWDRLQPWPGCSGIVVASPDTDDYCSRFPREHWSYLRRGILIDTTEAGLIHYPEADSELTLVTRGDAPQPEEWAELRRAQFARPNSEWRSGSGPSVLIGVVNPNGQICTGTRGKQGTDHLQLSYRAECGHCGHVYGANGSDIHERLCPLCQDGVPGLEY